MAKSNFQVKFRMICSGEIVVEAESQAEAEKKFNSMSISLVADHAEDTEIKVVEISRK